MKQINIVIPMAGLGSRFKNAGYTKPKPFIPVRGTGYTIQNNETQDKTQDKTMQDKTMIECVLQNLTMPNAKFFLIALKVHLAKEQKIIKRITKQYNATFIGIENLTQGAACSVLYASEFIDNDTPLLIANSDQIIDINISDFCVACERLDGLIMCFRDKTRNPKWSFVRTDEKHLVCEVREKEAISEYATSGIYLFSRGKIFVESAKAMIKANERVNNEFYVAPCYNYAIKKGAKIGVYEICQSTMHGIGTPQDLAEYERFLKSRTNRHCERDEVEAWQSKLQSKT